MRTRRAEPADHTGRERAVGRTVGPLFQSLHNRNYRIYFSGQLVSTAGTFMQTVAQAWLVLQLTGSGTALGVLTTLQFGPLVLFGGPGGVLADRMDRRRLYLVTQSVMCVEALVLGLLVTTGRVELWMVYVLAAVLGCITAVDMPVRQTIVLDIVGPTDLANAVSLNMTVGSVSRALGPAVAGVTIAVLGVGPCFLINAASFVVVIIALLLMRVGEMHPAVREPPARGQFRAGLAYVRASPELLSVLLMTALLFGLAWEFEVALPLFARFVFDGNAATYGVLASAVGIGAVFGGLESARRGNPSRTMMAVSAGVFGAAMWCATFAPTMRWEVPVLVVAGASGVAFAAVASTRLQLHTMPAMRGRVMALYAIAVFGTRVVGGPVVGWFGEHLGTRASLGIGAVAVTVALPVWLLLRPSDPASRQADQTAWESPAPESG